jgi:hypothetical protein
MRVLPGVVGPGSGTRTRRLTAVTGSVAAIAALAVLSGCAQFDAALGQREAVVSFRDGTPVSQKLIVRTTCAKVPAVTAQPLPPDVTSSPYALQQLTYRIDKASDADVAQLEKCLNKFPAVTGVNLQDSSDEGN